jgi:hypothetical protein
MLLQFIIVYTLFGRNVDTVSNSFCPGDLIGLFALLQKKEGKPKMRVTPHGMRSESPE